MAEVLDGWKNKLREVDGEDIIDSLLEAVRSDDGWYCPHCKHKKTDHDMEFLDEEYVSLQIIGEILELRCPECRKDYFLKAFTTVRYSTSTDKSSL